ncbi:MAG: putative AGC family protein kinase, partial [Streblomastix strix]
IQQIQKYEEEQGDKKGKLPVQQFKSKQATNPDQKITIAQNAPKIHTQKQQQDFTTTWKKSDFQKLQKLGKGKFGEVHLYKEIATQKLVAIKKMDYDTEQEKELVNKEIAMMRNVCNILRQNSTISFLPVVEPLGFFLNDNKDKAFLVLEYCSNGDLRKYIESMKKSRMEITPQLAYEIIAQIAFSMNQLHANGIIHSDLKPENVLLTEDFKVKLADFGLARQLQLGKDYTTNHGGTFLFQAPEVLSNKNKDSSDKDQIEDKRLALKLIQTTAVDIWAIGVMLFELLAQRHPFFDSQTEADVSAEEFIHRVISLPPAELPDHYPINLRNLIRRMLIKDPAQRIQADQILELPEVAAQLSQK